jgi:hypothetical protein
VVWPGAQSGLLGRGEVVVELEAPRRWRRWWRRRAPRRGRRWRLHAQHGLHVKSAEQTFVPNTIEPRGATNDLEI